MTIEIKRQVWSYGKFDIDDSEFGEFFQEWIEDCTPEELEDKEFMEGIRQDALYEFFYAHFPVFIEQLKEYDSETDIKEIK